jgi:hypothetical protein
VLHQDLEVMRLHTPLWFLLLYLTLLFGSIYKHRLILLALLFEVGWFIHEVTKF